MSTYRFIAGRIWIDDIFLSMSPEQKLLFLYLLAGPQTSMSGIFELSISNMGHQIGLKEKPARNLFEAFLRQFHELVLHDPETNEIGLIFWPKYNLINAGNKALRMVEQSLKEVRSRHILKAIIIANSSSSSKAYVKRLRQINVEEINTEKALKSADFESENANSSIFTITRPNSLNVNDVRSKGNCKYNISIYSSNSENCEPVVLNEKFDEYSFEKFWDKYGYKAQKKKALSAWNRLTKSKRKEAIDGIVKYDQHLKSEKWKRKMLPSTYLNGERWKDEHPGEKKESGNGFRMMKDGTLQAI